MNNEEFLEEMRRRREAAESSVPSTPQEISPPVPQQAPPQTSTQGPNISLGEVHIISDKTPVQERKGLVSMLIHFGIAKNSQQANVILSITLVAVVLIIIWIWI